MLETATDKHQILSDGKQVWVNSDRGMCIGRFSPAGVDIHLDYEEQVAQGKECLECFARTSEPDADWKRFVDGMKRYYALDIPEEHRPRNPLAPAYKVRNFA